MKAINFSQVLKFIEAENQWCGDDFLITGVSIDSRTINKGELFVALKGDKFDGGDFIDVAVQKGAAAILTYKETKLDIPVIVVPDTLKAYQQLAANYRRLFDIPVVAITGSNGKTTTREMIYTILSSKYSVLTPERNLNNGIGLPQTIFKLNDSHEVAVLEMGMNHLGEIDLLTRIASPTLALITNIGKAHIGLLGSQENIRKAKFEIVNGICDGGTLILNGNDSLLQNYTSNKFNVEYVGDCEETRLSVKDIEYQNYGMKFIFCQGDAECECNLSVMGIHNVYNAIEAVQCATHFGITLEQACVALKNFKSVSMRNEVSYDKGVAIIKDYYNASPDSMRVAIELLVNKNKNKKKIAILGQMRELGGYSQAEHKKLAELCNKSKLDYVFFIGDDYESFRDGIGDTPCQAFSSVERAKLSASLLEYVKSGGIKSGDIILIKGSRGIVMEDFYEHLKSYINSVMSDFTTLPPSPTRLYVDINAMKHNFFQIANSLEPGVEIMPMIKANAYGCGVDIIANIFKDCKYLAVADAKEAALIRRILPKANIMIIYQPTITDIDEIICGNYVSSVGDIEFAKALNQAAEAKNTICRIHIEVDTGAARLGISVDDCKAFAEEIKKLKNLCFEGIYMHYVCADSFSEEDLEFTKLQSTKFANAVSQLESVLGHAKYKHACAGAAIFNKNAVHYNMVRPGYMLYGYYPSEDLKSLVDLKPALKFVSVILKITEHEAGTPVSYNRRYVTKRKTKIATVNVGYSDGIYRSLFHPDSEKSGCFVVNGQRAPIVGSICMDLTMIDITDIEGEVKIGDEVAIFDNVNVTLNEMAELCGTIGYEIIARIEDKADRVEIFR